MVFIFLVVTWGLYPGRHEHRPCEQDAWAIDQQEGPHLMISLYCLYLFCSPNQHQHHHHHHSLDHSHHGPTQLRWTCSRSPLSPHLTSDRRRRPPWRESRITFFSTEIFSKNILFFLWTNILFPISSSSPHHPLEVEAGRSKAGALLLLFKNRDDHLHNFHHLHDFHHPYPNHNLRNLLWRTKPVRSDGCLNYTPASTLNAKRSQWKTGFAEDWEQVILISMQVSLDVDEDNIQGDKVNSPGARGPLRPTGDDAVMVTAD